MKKLAESRFPERPQYPIRILQFGGGNFLRAFVDWMVDVLNEETNFAGDVAIVKPTERGDYQQLRQQDGLFHVVLNGFKAGAWVDEKRRIQCIQRVVHPYKEWNRFLQLAELPELRFIVSNTTEAGIEFKAEGLLSNIAPETFPAKLTSWLHHRFQYFDADPAKACIILPVELVEQNGALLKACVLQYAQHWQLGTAFERWVEEQIFCNTLVDRIVSGYPQERAAAIEEELEVRDALLVAGEYYHSWVIEAPPQARRELPFDQTDLNVQFVDDLEIHRQIKVRILNGAHTAMVPLGYLAGCKTVDEYMDNPQLRHFLEALIFQEIIPTIDHPPAALSAFAHAVLERFRNPSLRHQLLDIALNSTSKFVTRLLPSLLVFCQQNGVLPHNIVLAFAALLRFYQGHWREEAIPLRDAPERIAFFTQCWQSPQTLDEKVAVMLGASDIWGMDLNSIKGLRKSLVQHLLRNKLTATLFSNLTRGQK